MDQIFRKILKSLINQQKFFWKNTRPLGEMHSYVYKKGFSTCLPMQQTYKRGRVGPWVRKILWKRAQQTTPVSLPEEFHGQKSPVGYSPWGKESDTTGASWHEHMHGYESSFLFKNIH